jgi:hypothetical protein
MVSNYSCNVCIFPPSTIGDGCDPDKNSYPLRVDATKNILEWRGKKYSLTVAENCGQFGWDAKGNGNSFKFCTGTQGYGAIRDENGKIAVRCNLMR